MLASALGRVLVIANPAARSGEGARAAGEVEASLAAHPEATHGFEVRSTAAAGDAQRMAAAAAGEGFDTVVALGGDGIVHEIVNGLMELPRAERPTLGLIPMGSGNDYARTLGMARGSLRRALEQLCHGRIREFEAGCVNGVYFMQTLSFGLDSAIALDTVERRAEGARQRGEALFMTSGLKVMGRARTGWPCTARFDGGEPEELSELVFAVQVGPTYGGGFRICPAADPADGLLDVCYNVRRPSIAHILALFALARRGAHAGSRVVRLRCVRRIELDFPLEPPVQVDGERLRGTHFNVEVVPAALRVVAPR